MNAIEYIRTHVFDVSQMAFAKIAGVNQGTVSRWESGVLWPDLQQIERLRNEAKARSLPWRDGWLFDVPRKRRRRAA
jgi:transcriptional regulator with XRE-family HTH domain